MAIIHLQAVLLRWLAEQLKRMVPQATVTQGTIHVLDDLISLLNESGRFYLDPSDWSDYLDEVFAITNRFLAPQPCSPEVPAFLSRIYGEVIATGEPVSRERAIEILIQMLRLEHLFRRKKGEGGRTFLVSTAAFYEAHGFKVRVKLKDKRVARKRRLRENMLFPKI